MQSLNFPCRFNWFIQSLFSPTWCPKVNHLTTYFEVKTLFLAICQHTWLSSRTRLFSRAAGQPTSGSAQAPSSLRRGWSIAECCRRGWWDCPMSISNSFSSAPWLSESRPRRRCQWSRRSRMFFLTTNSSIGPMFGTVPSPSELSDGCSSASRHNIWSVWFLTAVRSSLEDEGSCCSNTHETWTKRFLKSVTSHQHKSIKPFMSATIK